MACRSPVPGGRQGSPEASEVSLRPPRCAPKPRPPPLPTPAPTRSPSGCSRARRSPTTSTAACCRRSWTRARPSPGCASSRSRTRAVARYVLAGLGKREEFDAERARVAAASVAGRARELGTRFLCWELPHHVGDAEAGGFVEGTLLAAYAYRAHKSKPDEDGGIEQLALSAHHDVSAAVAARRRRGHGDQRRARPAARARQRAHADAARRARARARRRARDAHRRDDGPGRDRGGRHGRVRRRRPRQPRGAAADHAPLRAGGRRRARARPRRQGGDVRLGRHLAQARHEDERDEVRHVRRRGRARGHGGDRPARAARPASWP